MTRLTLMESMLYSDNVCFFAYKSMTLFSQPILVLIGTLPHILALFIIITAVNYNILIGVLPRLSPVYNNNCC